MFLWALSAKGYCPSLVRVLVRTLLDKAAEPQRVEGNRSRRSRWKEITLMDRLWFDQETGTLLLDEYVVEMDSYRRIVEDETISDDELVEQTQRVMSLLHQLEEVLSPEAKAIATEALGELAVLNTLQVKRLQAASVIPR
jgi:hypothetical protein